MHLVPAAQKIDPPETQPTPRDAALALALLKREGARRAAQIAGTSRQTLAMIALALEVRAGSLATFRARVCPTEPPHAA